MTSLRVMLRSRFGNPNLRYTQEKYLELFPERAHHGPPTAGYVIYAYFPFQYVF